MSVDFGEEFELAHGELRARISSVGATLLDFSCRAVPIVWGAPYKALPKGSSGQVLAPWPNRLADGRYRFDGIEAVAPLDEPLRNNAIHGLVRWLYWEREYLERDRVKLHCALAPQPAYPFQISLSVLYALSDEGLAVRVQSEQLGDGTAPFGVGFHPYFLGAVQGLQGARLVVPASRHYLVDARGLPVGDESLSGALSDLDSETGLALDDVMLDDCFAGLTRQSSGNAIIRYFPGAGEIEEVELRLDPSFDYVMCYTGDTLDEVDQRRGVAIEPMTCAPNAFVTGDGLRELSETSSFSADFVIMPKPARG
jgi:aldose 1-epimerase